MSVLSPPQPPIPYIPTHPVMPLTVDQYHAMIAAGILKPEDRAELLDGILVRKLSINEDHSVSTEATRGALAALLPKGWHLRSQQPITLPTSEPEPDVTIIRGSIRDYRPHHPTPADQTLVVEVAESSLERDRGIKLQLYAAAGVQVYWIVNLIDRIVEVYGQPVGRTYAHRQDFKPGELIPLKIDGVEVGRVPVDDLLP